MFVLFSQQSPNFAGDLLSQSVFSTIGILHLALSAVNFLRTQTMELPIQSLGRFRTFEPIYTKDPKLAQDRPQARRVSLFCCCFCLC